MSPFRNSYIVLGAGVIGLTTALELSARHPTKQIIIVAKHLPGDRSIEYTSPWAGANWLSTATDNGPEETRDGVTYRRFAELVKDQSACHEAGVYEMEPIQDAGVVSPATGRVWYDRLVRDGLRFVPQAELPDGAIVGYDFWSFVIDTGRYLAWFVITPSLFLTLKGNGTYSSCLGFRIRLSLQGSTSVAALTKASQT
jgi:D-amino-acid oxidase